MAADPQKLKQLIVGFGLPPAKPPSSRLDSNLTVSLFSTRIEGVDRFVSRCVVFFMIAFLWF
jgi:hypothetical protein